LFGPCDFAGRANGRVEEAIEMSIESRSETAPAAILSPAAVSESPPPPWLLWDLALMILVSAFLLFQVQPLISKFILPWFGGSPAVWTTCMLFFQSLLFCGYAYAHVTSRLLSCRGQAILHLALIAAAIVLLPIAPNASWKPQPGMEPTWRILGLLAASVGVPYFVLSATGPLGQAWFSRAYRERSPYRLFSLSNFGSLAALLTFPVLFEPMFAADVQAWLWSGAFMAFGLLCAGVAIWIWRNRGDEHLRNDAATIVASAGLSSAASDEPSLGRRALWLVLPAFASLMFLATTNAVCQNVAVVPFLWVVPLSLYLLSFIICFDHERWYRRGPYAIVTAICVFMSGGGWDAICDGLTGWFPQWFSYHDPQKGDPSLTFFGERILWLATLFLVCMICHGELVRLRPKPKYLTEYYLLIAAGGAIGGVFVGLVAPHIFPGFFEWNLGLAAAFIVAGIYCLLAIRRSNGPSSAAEQPKLSASQSAMAKPISFAVAALLLLAGTMAIAYWQWDEAKPADEPNYKNIHQRRNFYGVVKVYDLYATKPDRHYLQFRSGGVSHGRQWVSDDPAKRRAATAYYAPETGAGRAITYFQKKPNMRIGVVGLGVGTLATYANQPGHYVKFYEINPEVATIANTYFSYLKECEGRHEIAMGDARLSMESELNGNEPQHFDVLVLDAFSGDAPPAHLLTREAFGIYRQHLNPDGIIAVNIKNRYVNLAPVVKAAADYYGFGTTRIWTDENKPRLLYEVDYMLLTNNEEFLKANPPILAPGVSPEIEPAPWTDHYNNLFQLLMRK
jgi:hypothetical protein